MRTERLKRAAIIGGWALVLLPVAVAFVAGIGTIFVLAVPVAIIGALGGHLLFLMLDAMPPSGARGPRRRVERLADWKD